jgi:CSLREA domain-containing protein
MRPGGPGGWAVALAAFMFVNVGTAGAATLTVTTTSDSISAGDGQCSLREAIAAVNSSGAAGDCGTAAVVGNTIVLGPHAYSLSIHPQGADDNATGDLDVAGAVAGLVIAGSGPSATSVSGSGLGDRLLKVIPGAQVTVRDLALTAGHAPDGATGSPGSSSPATAGGAGGNGGGIENSGSLTLDQVVVSGNFAGNGGQGGHGGSFSAAGAIGGNGGEGGAIFNAGTGTLVLSNTAVTGNRSGDGGHGGIGIPSSPSAGGSGGAGGCCGDGGGLANAGGSVTITGSTFSGNIAGNGGSGGSGGSPQGTSGAGGAGGSGQGGSSGGAMVSANGSVSITNSTIAGNLSGTGGDGGDGGIVGPFPDVDGAPGAAGNGSAGGGIFVRTSAGLTLHNVTIAQNRVGGPGTPGAGGTGGTVSGSPGAAAFGGGMYVSAASAGLDNTLLASNQLGNCAAQNAGSITDGGHNLSFGETSCPSTFASGDPRLAALQDNAGLTQTMDPAAGSAAIDAGAGCPGTDQRGLARPSGAACDIGAYEVTPPGVGTPGAAGVTSSQASVSDAVTANARSATVAVQYGPTSGYGAQTPTQTASGLLPVTVASSVTGLRPSTTYHYRFVATSADGSTASPDHVFTTASSPPGSGSGSPPTPKLGKVLIRPSRFKAGSGKHRGTTITYTDSVAAKTTFAIFKPVPGRRRNHRCVSVGRHPRGAKCVRLVKVGSFTHKDRRGGNRVHFSGRLHGHVLRPGLYELTLTPRSGGKSGASVTRKFHVLKSR